MMASVCRADNPGAYLLCKPDSTSQGISNGGLPRWVTSGDAIPLVELLPIGFAVFSLPDFLHSDFSPGPQISDWAEEPAGSTRGDLLRPPKFENKSVFYTGNTDSAEIMNELSVSPELH